jgi:hypothetical protein
MDDGQLRFRFADVARELRETETLAKRFLDRGSRTALSDAADWLSRLKGRRGEQNWGLASELRTRASKGYERRHRQGEHSIYAAIDATWAITPENTQTFRVTGNVSTRVRLIDGDTETEWGLWRVELGAKGAPGCFFHSQILGQDGHTDPPWPHSVPIPRLPTPFVSVPSVLTFVLGEMFQTEWARHVDHSRSQRLATDQRKAWERRLEWELQVIRGTGSLPWSRLKRSLPPRDLFCEAATGG